MIRTKVTPSFNPYPLFDSSTTTDNISPDGTQVFQLESYRAEELLFEHNPPYILTLPFEKILAKGKRAAKHKIPRPLNQFMIFRKDFEARYKLEHPDERLSTTCYTKMATEAWNKLPGQTKRYFIYLQREAEKWHKRTYPNYKFSPKKKERIRKKKCRKESKKRENAGVISNPIIINRTNKENNTANNDYANHNDTNAASHATSSSSNPILLSPVYPSQCSDVPISSTQQSFSCLSVTSPIITQQPSFPYDDYSTPSLISPYLLPPAKPDNTFVNTLSTTTPPLTPCDNGSSNGYSYGEHIENVINEMTNGNVGQQTKGDEWANEFGYRLGSSAGLDDLRKCIFVNMGHDMNHDWHADTDINRHLDNIITTSVQTDGHLNRYTFNRSSDELRCFADISYIQTCI
ncbi:264_t:CDS:2 [Paraglomus occultum]|uniref:264_t:CDS:1 n=1 Tax=Paraglomus occultum TaxID=144539 RepID=A0A9N8ZTY5_9GLOM|nr:264_t:CDS:2 [Paraglomus occultum]